MENKNTKTPNQNKKIRKMNISRPITSREYDKIEQEVYTSWLDRISEYIRSDKDVIESNLLYVEPNIYI